MASRGLTYDQLMAAVQRKELSPLYFLFGEESFLMDDVQSALLEHALQPHERDFNLDIVYGAEADVRQVLALCSGYPVMAERRVVVVRDFDRLEGNTLFKGYAEKPNPTAIVLLLCNRKPNLATHPYRALREHAVWAEFQSITSRKLPSWIKAYVERHGYRIEPAALHMLGEFLDTDLRTAASEIEKLFTFIGERKEITSDDVLRAAGQTREFSVFELQRAIAEQRFNDAVRISNRLLTKAANPLGEALKIVAVLTSFYTKLWRLLPLMAERLPEKAMAGQIGVPPYYMSEYLGAVRRLGLPGVERSFSALLAADFELKGGATQSANAILLLLLSRLITARG